MDTEKPVSWASIYRRKEPCPLCGEPKAWHSRVCGACNRAMIARRGKGKQPIRWYDAPWNI